MKTGWPTGALITLTSAVAGAFLGAVVQGFLDSPMQIAFAALALLCLLALAAASALRDRDRIMNELARQVTDHIRQSGMRVYLQDAEKIKELNSTRDDPVSQLMLQAKHSILILDFISLSGEWPDGDINREHMRKHHEAIIGHVRSSLPPIEYKRICQVEVDEDGDSDLQLLRRLERAKNTEAHDHYLAMTELSKQLHDPTMISIKLAAQKYPYKFIIIDGQSIVLSLQRFNEDRNLNLWGELLIADAKPDLLRVFMRIWRDLENNSVPFVPNSDGMRRKSGSR